MGQLVDQGIPTLFGGVSRQPQPVRNKNQVQEGNNALFSVVTGGFEKRPPSQHIAALSGLDTNDEHAVFWIDRDNTEQYAILINPTDGSIHAYNAITGSPVTVNIGDSTRFFLIDQTGINVTGVIGNASYPVAADASETTFDWEYSIDNGSVVFKVEGSADGSTWNDLATGKTGTSGSFSTTVDAVATGDHNFVRFSITTSAGGPGGGLTVKATFADKTYLIENTPDPEDFALTSIADTSLLVNKKVVASMENPGTGGVTSNHQNFSDLEAAVTPSGTGNIYRILGDDVNNFGRYYVVDDPSTNKFLETSRPDIANFIAASTMPHELVRESNGTFTFRTATWNGREVGDNSIVPDPNFIGRTISDVAFFGNRMALASDEEIYLGEQGDLFDMWPEKAIQQQDTDPIDRSAATNQVNILEWLAVFRKLLFATSAIAQFELAGSGAQLTPTTASFDRATSYPASIIAKPETMGDLLYFASSTPVASVIYEYLFDEASLSNTAVDISRHVQGYIPTEVTHITSDPTTGSVFLLSSGETQSIFVYRVFFDGSNKVQSSWSKYTLGDTGADAFVLGAKVLSGFLVLVVERPDGIFLEQVQVEREAPDTDLGFIPLIDQRTVVTGSYNAGTGITTFTSPYEHDDDLVVVLGGSFDVPGTELVLAYPSATTATATGDFSAGQVYIGRPYEMAVELSKQFFRPSDDSPSILNGRFQVRDITFSHENTGYYRVEVTPKSRDTLTYEFTGRVLGEAENIISGAAIENSGEFTAGVLTDGQTGRIVIKNDTPLPSVITSASIRAFFNETSRQG